MESVFLGTFLFGLLMVLASVVLGFAHLALPGAETMLHAGGHHGGVHGGSAHHAGADGNGQGGHGGLPLWNISTLLAFLMWFGAAGWVTMQVLELPALLALLPATGFGIAGALAIAGFLRLVLRGETQLRTEDFRMEGTLARVTVSIPERGTGEIIFSKGNTRRGEGARSIDGRPIRRDEEVVVLEYQHGIALVQRWEDFKQDGPLEMLAAPAPDQRS